MEYLIEIYLKVEDNKQKVIPIGKSELSDKSTYDFYKVMFDSNANHVIAFNPNINKRPHGFLNIQDVDSSFPYELDNRHSVKVLVTNINSLRMLTQEEWNNLTITDNILGDLPTENWNEIIKKVEEND